MAQIPALVISTAAGVIVTRVATHQDVGEQMVSQLFNNPRVMMLSAAVIGLLGLVPGMPNIVFLLFTLMLLGMAWLLRRHAVMHGETATASALGDNPAPETRQSEEASWDDVQPEDTLGLEVGYRLIPMVDSSQGLSC
ncbi:Flagellar biosynthesis protein FlhA [Sodalis praecaptivus]